MCGAVLLQAQRFASWADEVLLLNLPRFVPRREHVRASVWLVGRGWLLPCVGVCGDEGGPGVGAAGSAPLSGSLDPEAKLSIRPRCAEFTADCPTPLFPSGVRHCSSHDKANCVSSKAG